jgi:hypothetical protein
MTSDAIAIAVAAGVVAPARVSVAAAWARPWR